MTGQYRQFLPGLDTYHVNDSIGGAGDERRTIDGERRRLGAGCLEREFTNLCAGVEVPDLKRFFADRAVPSVGGIRDDGK